jgi:hypothetical protein
MLRLLIYTEEAAEMYLENIEPRQQRFPRRWDYFVRNLLGAEPPHDYAVKTPPWYHTLDGE